MFSVPVTFAFVFTGVNETLRPYVSFVTSEVGIMGMHYIFKFSISFWGKIFNYLGKTQEVAI